MLLDLAIVLLVGGVAYFIGRHDGRVIEERSWINSYNNLGVDDE